MRLTLELEHLKWPVARDVPPWDARDYDQLLFTHVHLFSEHAPLDYVSIPVVLNTDDQREVMMVAHELV